MLFCYGLGYQRHKEDDDAGEEESKGREVQEIESAHSMLDPFWPRIDKVRATRWWDEAEL